ncbi:MAG: hypothetical protein Q8S33_10665 [Myxococcales bacterium]|nr:hypothetical protein [Myxococcales bacterium]
MRRTFLVLAFVLSACLSPVDESGPSFDAGPSAGGAGGPVDAGFGGGGGASAAGGASQPIPGVIPGVTCSDSNVCWDTVYGGTFHAVAGTSSFVVAVGEGGVIATWNGSLTYSASPTKKSLRGVWFETATRGWAVGDDGVMLEWDGTTWRLVPSGTTNHLFTIHGSGATVFAAGHEVVVWRKQGAWEVAPVPLPVQGSPARVRSLVVRSANEAYLVGVASAGFFMRYDGSGWLEEAAPRQARRLNDLAVCGDSLFVSAAGATFRRLNGSWSEVATQGARVACLSETAFVSFGAGESGSNERITIEGGQAGLVVSERFAAEAAFVAGPRDIFFVGAGGAFNRWTGAEFGASATRTRKLSTSGSSAYRLVVGERVEHLMGTQWVELFVPGADVISDLYSPQPDELWVLRGTTANHLRGGQWVSHALPVGTGHVRGSGPSNVWFSGASTVAHWDGVSLRTETLPTRNLTGPAHVTASQTWLPTWSINGVATSLRRDASGWQSSPVSAWRIWGVNDDVYLSHASSLSRWNGSGMELVRENVDVRAVGIATDAIYLLDLTYRTGPLQTAVKLVRTTGQVVPLSLGTSENIAQIAVGSAGDVWFVTEAGGLLRLSSQP